MIVVAIIEITRLIYNEARKRKDDVIAEFRAGYIIQRGDKRTMYVTSNNKCYRGDLMPWHDPVDIQDASFDGVHIATNALFTAKVTTEVKGK